MVAAVAILRTPGSSSLHRALTRVSPPVGAEDVDKMRTDAAGGDREQLDAHRFGQRLLVDLGPQFVEVEQPLGDQEGR